MTKPQSSATASIFSKFKKKYKDRQPETLSLHEYLERCATDRMAYANAAERLLDAIGKAEIVDTANDKGPLGRIFQGKTIARYPAFADFFGAEETVDKIVSHLRGAAAGEEYSKQVLYLLGPVGGGKSSLGDRLKDLMEQRPIYVLKSKATGEISPFFENPLALFDSPEQREEISEHFKIPERYMKVMLSPWAVKRLKEADGDVEEAFEVQKVWPSLKHKIAIAKVEPGDENNQDTSVLVGKVDLNKLGEGIPQSDIDTYLCDGGFQQANQGILEFVEMFKAPLKVLNPMLEALQSGNYQGTQSVGAMPFYGIIFAHSNESEWNAFCADKKNEAILDRVNVVHVPYTLRMSEEAKIYQKRLSGSGYSKLPIAPKTIDFLAKFSVMSRLSDAEGVAKYPAKVRVQVYDGEIPEGPSSKVPTIAELRKFAPAEEGMSGISTRFAFKTLTETFNAKANEGYMEADPILLMEVLEQRIKAEKRIPAEQKTKLLDHIAKDLMPEYVDFLKQEITAAFTGASDDMCQNIFDRYIDMADAWINSEPFNDKGVTGKVMTREELDKKLAEIEKPCGINNTSDFRNEVVRYVMRQQAKTGEKVRWDSYKKMADVINKMMFKTMKDVLPVIKFDGVIDDEKQAKKRDQFMENMQARGYTPTMIKRAVGLYERTVS